LGRGGEGVGKEGMPRSGVRSDAKEWGRSEGKKLREGATRRSGGRSGGKEWGE